MRLARKPWKYSGRGGYCNGSPPSAVLSRPSFQNLEVIQMADKKGLSNGQGRLNTDDRGGLPDMRTPYARMPLKNDVAMGEAAPAPRSKDPLGYFPSGTGVNEK